MIRLADSCLGSMAASVWAAGEAESESLTATGSGTGKRTCLLLTLIPLGHASQQLCSGPFMHTGFIQLILDQGRSKEQHP